LESTLTDADFARFMREIRRQHSAWSEAEDARLERHRRARGVRKRRGAKDA
jgi:hypothetical protein